MLGQIRDLLTERPVASITEIASHLGTNTEAARGMVDVWVRKNRAMRVPMACGSCTECGSDATELYQWVTESAPMVLTAKAMGVDPGSCEL